MKLLLQDLVLITSFILIFIWQLADLTEFTTPFLGGLIAIYLIISARKKGKGFLNMGGEGPYGIFILNTLIFLLIFSTGSIDSPIFFLLYFLAFGIAFIFEPAVIFVFVLGTLLVFLPEALTQNATDNLLKLGSVVLLSPLAFFFGKEYRRNLAQESEVEDLKERTREAADIISKDVEEIIKGEKGNLKEKDIAKLNEVLEETEDLREESKQNL